MLTLVQSKAYSQDKVFPEDSWGVYSWTRFTKVDKNNAPLIKGGPLITRWVDIEPQDGVYKFKTEIDDVLQKALDNDWYTFINIWVAGPSESGWTPEWLYDKGIPKVACGRGNFPYYFHNYVPGQPPASNSYQYYYFRLLNAIAKHILSLPANLRERVVFIQCAEGSTGDGYCYKGDVLSGYEQYEISREDWNVFRLDAWKEFKAAYSVDGKLQIPLLTNDDANNVELRQWMLAELDVIGVKQGMSSHGYQISDAQERVAAHKAFKQQAEAADKVFFARGEMDGEMHEFAWITQNKTQGLYWSAIYATHCGLNHWNMPQDDCKLSIHNNAFNFFNKHATHFNQGPSDYAFCAFYRGLDASDTQEFPVSQYGSASKSNQQRYVNICNAYSQYGANMADPEAATGGGMKNRSATGYNDAGWKIIKTNFQRHITQIDAEETSAAWWQVDESIYGRFARGFEPSSNKDTMYFDIDDNFFPDNQTVAKSNIKLKVIYRDADPGSWSLKYHAADGSMKTAFSVTNSGSGWKSKEILIEDALLNNGGDRGADLILQNDGGTNCRFHLIELTNVGPTVAVEGVSINGCPASDMNEGATQQLTATVSPSDATNKDVSWESLSPGVATVDPGSGLLTAVSVGSATIKVTTNDGSFTDSCFVTVTASQGLAIPGTIQAEDYVTKHAVITNRETHIGNFAVGRGVTYKTTVAHAGDYTLTLYVATSRSTPFNLTIETDNPATTQTFNFDAGTGNWNIFKEVVIENVTLPAGAQTITLISEDNAFNLDWFSFTNSDSTAVTYALTAKATAGGSVTPASGTYNDGTVVTLTATPDAGYVFTGWSGDLSGTANPEDITMGADKNVTANFAAVSTGVAGVTVTLENTVKMYPNPVNNGLLTISSTFTFDTVRVFSLTGKLIHQEQHIFDTSIEMNLENVENGMYFIQIESKQTQITKKIIVG